MCGRSGFGPVLACAAVTWGPAEGRGGKPSLELGLELELYFENALHLGWMRWIVDAARDRRILWS